MNKNLNQSVIPFSKTNLIVKKERNNLKSNLQINSRRKNIMLKVSGQYYFNKILNLLISPTLPSGGLTSTGSVAPVQQLAVKKILNTTKSTVASLSPLQAERNKPLMIKEPQNISKSYKELTLEKYQAHKQELLTKQSSQLSGISTPVSLSNSFNTPVLDKVNYALKKSNVKINSKLAMFESQNSSFFFNKVNNISITNIYTFLENSFKNMSCLISIPVFAITSDKVVVRLFYYLIKPTITKGVKYGKRHNSFLLETNTRKSKDLSFLNENNKNIENICSILSGYFNKPVELELVRTYYPHYSSNIFVNLVGLIINEIKLRKVLDLLYSKIIIKNPNKIYKSSKKSSLIPAFLSGIKIKVAGRLLTNRVIPRKTVQTSNRGVFAKSRVLLLETARFTNKNKRGAYSITMSMGHVASKINK